MRILSTLTVLLYCSVLVGQNLLPEVVIVVDTRKVQTRKNITQEIRQAEKTNMVFPLKSCKKFIPYPGCYMCCSPRSKAEVKPVKIQFRCAASLNPVRPLVTIDGLIMEDNRIPDSLKPDHIESIEVLKDAAALAAYGSKGSRGVIIITTKRSAEDRLVIKDLLDKSPVPKATVSFVFPERKDTLRYIADDSGIVVSNSLSKLEGREMIVSAVGYKTVSGSFSINRYPGKMIEQLLERDVKICPEVIITCFDCTRKISCGGWIKVIRGSAEKIPVVDKSKLTLYPNPVARGGLINIEYPVTEEKLLLSVTSIDGKMILARPFSAAVREQLQTSLWPGGTYIIRLVYANGRVAASQKLVIQ